MAALRRVELRLAGDEALWVEGPARVEVASGFVYAGGVVAGEGSAFIVQAGRSASIYPAGEARLVLSLGRGSSHRVERGGEGVRVAREWLRLLEELEGLKPRSVMVLAPVESGKSTLSTWTANRLRGCYASLDAGQNELGTPGYYSAAPVQGVALTPKDLSPRWAWLVGCNAPEQCHWPAVAAAASLARFTLEKCSAVVMDTDGFVEGPGLVYKASLLEAVHPDVAVVLRRGPWLALRNAARAYADTVLEAPPAPRSVVRERGRRERREYRERMYMRLFANAEKMDVRLDETPVLNAVLGGVPSDPLAPRGALLAADGRLVEPRRLESWRRLLASLVTVEGYEVPALVENVSPEHRVLTLRVAWKPGAETRAVKLGFTRLTGDWREERLPPKPHPV